MSRSRRGLAAGLNASRNPAVHGAPLHVEDPEALGIPISTPRDTAFVVP